MCETILQGGNRSVCGIFLDFAKAFSRINHQILLDKLNHYGVIGNAHKLLVLSLYLNNRIQYTVYDEKFCVKFQPITIGVLQGSALGRFFFLVYINHLPNSYNSNVILYADDSTVICSEKNIHYLTLKCNSELGNMEN